MNIFQLLLKAFGLGSFRSRKVYVRIGRFDYRVTDLTVDKILFEDDGVDMYLTSSTSYRVREVVRSGGIRGLRTILDTRHLLPPLP